MEGGKGCIFPSRELPGVSTRVSVCGGGGTGAVERMDCVCVAVGTQENDISVAELQVNSPETFKRKDTGSPFCHLPLAGCLALRYWGRVSSAVRASSVLPGALLFAEAT